MCETDKLYYKQFTEIKSIISKIIYKDKYFNTEEVFMENDFFTN